MHYDKINLLHIPKTAGWYIREELLDYVIDPLERVGVRFIELTDHYHACWSTVDDRTYVISSFRDPVKRLVSHFSYMIGLRDFYYNLIIQPEYKEHNVLSQNVLNNTKQVWYRESTVESLMDWIEENKFYLSNFQSKNLVFDYNVNDHELFWNDYYFELVGKGLKKEQIYHRLGKIKIFLKDTQLTNKNMILLRDKIKNDFDLKSVKTKGGYWDETVSISPWNSGHNHFEGSSVLYEQLTQKQKDYIYSFNEIDTEIYNDYSLFWNNGL